MPNAYLDNLTNESFTNIYPFSIKKLEVSSIANVPKKEYRSFINVNIIADNNFIEVLSGGG